MNRIEPIYYKICLEPDLRRFQFTGRAEIQVRLLESLDQISLNVLDLSISSCRIRAAGELQDCIYRVEKERERLVISLPKGAREYLEVIIAFKGDINDRMVGFYRSKVVIRGQERTMAVTQFEESDARRAFPCFDQPSQKAVFAIEMVLDQGLTAISNTPVREEMPLEDGRRLVRFEKTPKMSTYLLFLGVGEFEFIEDPGDVLVRAAVMPGMAEKVHFGLHFARKCLVFCEEYYGIPYPLPKLDLIAVSDFAAGAMENWGAITFRENLFLHDPLTTSRAGEKRICEVIAHEIAHQWFGNLVTPSDWKYLWLNESFATYFGYGVVDHYHPDWGVWEQFIAGETRTAMDRDSLLETFPIELPGGEHVVINASTAPIIYNKGASLLRQVEAYLGKRDFKEGLRRYLKKHAYACASSMDLWGAMEEVSQKPISLMMKGWIEQPGFPLLHVQREGDTTLHVTQERFCSLPVESGEAWIFPLDIEVFTREGTSRVLNTLFEGREIRIHLGKDIRAYKVNAGQRGFYVVRYHDEENLRELARRAAEKSLSAEDRWGLENDLFALARRGDASVDDYLTFLEHYGGEDAFLPVINLLVNLEQIHLIMGKGYRDKVTSIGKDLSERILGTIGYEPRVGEALTDSLLRERLLGDGLQYGSEKVMAFALDQFLSLSKGKKVHPDLMKGAMQAGAFLKGREAFDWLEKRFGHSEDEHDRMNVLSAMGCFREKVLIQAAQAYILDQVPSRNRFVTVAAMGINPYAVPLLWDWYVANHHSLESLHPMHYERVIGAIVPFAGLGREEEVRSFMGEHMKRTDRGRDVIRLSLERLEINSRMRSFRLWG